MIVVPLIFYWFCVHRLNGFNATHSATWAIPFKNIGTENTLYFCAGPVKDAAPF